MHSKHAIIRTRTVSLAKLSRPVVHNECAIRYAREDSAILYVLARKSLKQAWDELQNFDAVRLQPTKSISESIYRCEEYEDTH